MTYSVFIRQSPVACPHLDIPPHRRSDPRALAGLATLHTHHRLETADSFQGTDNAGNKEGIRGRSTDRKSMDQCSGLFVGRNSRIESWNRPRFQQLVDNDEAVYAIVLHLLLIGVLQSIAVVGFCHVKFFGVVDSGQERLLILTTGTDEMSQD